MVRVKLQHVTEMWSTVIKDSLLHNCLLRI